MAEKELREGLQHRYRMLMGVLHLTKNSGCNFWNFAVANRKVWSDDYFARYGSQIWTMSYQFRDEAIE